RVKLSARDWFRVHLSAHGPVHFSLQEIHRYSHPDCPASLLYLGSDVATCLFERFGDLIYDQQTAIPLSLWRAHSISAIQVPAIHVCDLTHGQTLSSLRVDLTALMHNELEVAQAWGLA